VDHGIVLSQTLTWLNLIRQIDRYTNNAKQLRIVFGPSCESLNVLFNIETEGIQMSEKTSKEREEIEFTGKRIRHYSKLGFDDVLSRLRARVGKITIENVVELGKTREEFEEKIQQFIGESGFMLFSEIDHGHWIEPFGIKRRLLRWIFGNPLIAITMIRHDYTAGLFVPIELLLAESDDGLTCNVTYVVPSSLIVVDTNPQLLSAAQALDAKAEALVVSAVTA
jgi:uncharacterized protein (DUF302 family)